MSELSLSGSSRIISGHVSCSSHYRTSYRVRCGVQNFDKAKIHENGQSIGCEHDVGRFYVTMEHALFMSISESITNSNDDIDDLFEGYIIFFQAVAKVPVMIRRLHILGSYSNFHRHDQSQKPERYSRGGVWQRPTLLF